MVLRRYDTYARWLSSIKQHVGSAQYGYLRPVGDTCAHLRIRVGMLCQKVAKNLEESLLLDMFVLLGVVTGLFELFEFEV